MQFASSPDVANTRRSLRAHTFVMGTGSVGRTRPVVEANAAATCPRGATLENMRIGAASGVTGTSLHQTQPMVSGQSQRAALITRLVREYRYLAWGRFGSWIDGESKLANLLATCGDAI
jgi:hypothetical protein